MKEMKASELLAFLGSIVGVITVAQTMMHTLLPPPLRDLLRRLFDRLREYFTRYHYVDVPENDESWIANELYGAIKLHLSANAISYTPKAKRVKLCRTSTSAEFTWSPARNETVPMTFRGTKVWWEHHISSPSQVSHHQPWLARTDTEEKRKYTLRVHKRDKTQVIGPYMEDIMKQAMDIKHNNRQRLLYTNGKGGDSYRALWDFVPFKHPSTFETLAMDPMLKQKIQDDLLAFAGGQEYYKKTGRAWKRGYLLHGPPGTGKSSLIGAMANFLRYDVYDLELTQVQSNGDLRKMLLRTTSKSIIVIEDIDCSLDLANNRGKKLSASSSSSRRCQSRNEDGGSKDEVGLSAMTLSGLLNFTDGLWSCCGEERIFVFTTNHVENLDPALLRPGRMDMHILMSYCTYPAFEILADNYLCLKHHHLFPKVQEIINQAHITPAEVSEVFMRRRDEPDIAMEELMVVLEVAKAKPWPPPAPAAAKKVAVEKNMADEAKGEDVEEVKKAVDVSEKVGTEAEKKRCACCSCRCRAESSVSKRHGGGWHGAEKGQGQEEKKECVEELVEDGDGVSNIVDKNQMPPSKNKKTEKAE